MRPHALLAGAALFLGACAAQTPDPITISEVNVAADIAAIGNRNAVGYWQGLESDLQAAIASEFVGRIEPGGRIVNVDVDELSLQTAMTAGLTDEDARLSGQVEVISSDGTTTYDVTASTRDAITYLPPGANITTVPPTSAEFYRAVVQAFARGTAEVVLGTDAG
jgi:hypothetical protein